MNTTATTMTKPKNRPPSVEILVDSTSEIADSRNAPTTGPRIDARAAEHRHDDHLDVERDVERADRIEERDPVGVDAARQRVKKPEHRERRAPCRASC